MFNLRFFLFLGSAAFLLTASFLPAEQIVKLEEKEVSVSEDEVEVLTHLINENEKHLAAQKKLQALMKEFQKQEDDFFYGNQTKKHAFLMVSTAREILGMIKEEHLSHLFSSEYLEELVVFSSIAGKNAPVRP